MSASGIYGLVDSSMGRVVYVGRGFDIEARYTDHVREALAVLWESRQRGWIDYPVIRTKHNCLAYLMLAGVPIDLYLIEAGPKDSARLDWRERYWAKTLLTHGHPLSNGDRASTRLGSYDADHKGNCPYTAGLPLAKARDFDNPWSRHSSKTVIPLSGILSTGERRVRLNTKHFTPEEFDELAAAFRAAREAMP